MSLSDCPKCGGIPCTCGYRYEMLPLATVRRIHEATGNILRAAEGHTSFPWKLVPGYDVVAGADGYAVLWLAEDSADWADPAAKNTSIVRSREEVAANRAVLSRLLQSLPKE